MNTAQIQIGDTYALPMNGVTVRFAVTAITTVTKRTQRKDKGLTTNLITGVVEQGDMPDEPHSGRIRQVSPKDLLGPYEEYAELKAKQDEESRISSEKKAKFNADSASLLAKLYLVTGMPQPENPRSGDSPFTDYYSQGIHITPIGVPALLEALEKMS